MYFESACTSWFCLDQFWDKFEKFLSGIIQSLNATWPHLAQALGTSMSKIAIYGNICSTIWCTARIYNIVNESYRLSLTWRTSVGAWTRRRAGVSCSWTRLRSSGYNCHGLTRRNNDYWPLSLSRRTTCATGGSTAQVGPCSDRIIGSR